MREAKSLREGVWSVLWGQPLVVVPWPPGPLAWVPFLQQATVTDPQGEAPCLEP